MADHERWRKQQDLLAELWPLTDEERASYLDQHCGDLDLRREIEELLAAGDGADSYLDSLAARVGMGADEEAPPAEDLSGHVVGAYRLLEPLGRGGMGVVYLAERADGAFDTRVAVKLLPLGVTTPEARARFLAERQILADLKHPAIAQLLDGGVTEDGTPYFVMELVEGERIDRWCDDHGLDIPERIRLMIKVCEAVDVAHRRLVVHRDLKPSNVMVERVGPNENGRPKLLDFGVAKVLSEAGSNLTRSHASPGTPAWAAPEQIEGGPATTATDTHGLGAILYQLSVGVPPHDLDGASPVEMLTRIRSEPTPPERRFAGLDPEARKELTAKRSANPHQLQRQLTGDLSAILQKALAVEPERRYGSAATLAADLRRHLDGRPVEALAPSVGYRLRRFMARHRLGVAAGALVVLSLVAGLSAAVWQARVAAMERDLARAQSERAGQVTDFLQSLFKASDPDRARGREVSARDLLDQGAHQVRSRFEDAPELRAEMMVLLGDLYRELGEEDSAQLLLEEGMQLAGSAGLLDLQVDAMRGLAQVEMEAGGHEQALARLKSAEELLRQAGRVPGEQHASLVQPLLFSLTETGHGDAAVERGREVLAQARSAKDLPASAMYEYLFAVGMALSIAEQRDEADELLREAEKLEFEESDDPTVRIALLSQLASGRAARGDLVGSLNHSQVARELAEKVYPPGHSQRARILSNLGSALNPLGRFKESESVLREALGIYEQIYGADGHPRVAAAHNNLGNALRQAEDYTAAEPHLAEAREQAGKFFGLEDPRYAIATANLGVLYRQLGRLGEAEGLLQESLRVRRAALPADHPQIGNTHSFLAELRLEQGRPEAALALTDEAIAVYQRAGYEGARSWIATLERRARAFENLGRPDDAAEAFADAIRRGEAAPDDAGSSWPRLLAAHAAFLVGQQDPQAADATERALVVHRSAYGDGHPATHRMEELLAAAGAS